MLYGARSMSYAAWCPQHVVRSSLVHLHARDVGEEMAKLAARAFEQPFRAELLAVVLIEHRTASRASAHCQRWTTAPVGYLYERTDS